MEDCTKSGKRISEAMEVKPAPSSPSVILTPKRTKCSPSPPQLNKVEAEMKALNDKFFADSVSSLLNGNRNSTDCVAVGAESTDLKVEGGGAAGASSYATSNGNSDSKKAEKQAEYSGEKENKFEMKTAEKIPPPDSPPTTSSIIQSLKQIDELFYESEKQEQKRFAEKYNFDIVKEVPMEGRYIWEQVKP